MSYLILRNFHVGAVVVSFGLFVLRGLWMLRAPHRLRARWVRVIPHVVDTFLLATAIALAVQTVQYPFAQAWLTAKVIALTFYILLGMVALRHGRTRVQRVVAWISALAVFAYIVMVALTRDPVPWAGMADW
jgi:uncharacterized membrane protein SirB2